jgi:putative membrane protein
MALGRFAAERTVGRVERVTRAGPRAVPTQRLPRRAALVLGAACLCLALAPATALADGAGGGAWWSRWSTSPLQIAPIALGAVLYAVRARRLGSRLPLWRALCFFGGILLLLAAVASPVDALAEELFSVHMIQHVLLGDLGALLIVLGVTGPILRPALRLRWVQRLRALSHPAVALPLWAANIYVWHLPVLYEAALDHTAVHSLEHVAFFSFGCLMWAPLIEPLPAPSWFGTGAKLAYVGAVRAFDAVLGNIFWWSGEAFYPTYERTAPLHGMTPLEDQINAGTVMMLETGTVTLALFVILFFRMAREGELRQRLIESGLDEAAVRRAVRYGRGEVMAARAGLDASDASSAYPPSAPSSERPRNSSTQAP